MASFDEVQVLAELPERTAFGGKVTVDRTDTQVEGYVRDVVENVDVLTPVECDLDTLCEALFEMGSKTPISLANIMDALSTLDPDQRKEFLKIPRFYARAMRTLNGPDVVLVSKRVAARAAEKEKVMAGMPHGWGITDPPLYATSWRLLVGSGLPAELLPKYKTLPPKTRGSFLVAWQGACMKMGWDECDPAQDVKAQTRLMARRNAGPE